MTDWLDVSRTVVGTAMSNAEIAERFDLGSMEHDEIEWNLSEAAAERCPGCEWWYDAYDLLDDESDLVGCDDCR